MDSYKLTANLATLTLCELWTFFPSSISSWVSGGECQNSKYLHVTMNVATFMFSSSFPFLRCIDEGGVSRTPHWRMGHACLGWIELFKKILICFSTIEPRLLNRKLKSRTNALPGPGQGSCRLLTLPFHPIAEERLIIVSFNTFKLLSTTIFAYQIGAMQLF